MVATAPAVPVLKPTPSMPLRYGLFQAAVGPLDLPVRSRIAGVRYETAICGRGFGYEVECPPSAQDSKSAAWNLNGVTSVVGQPFVVFATMQCGAAGYSFEEDRAFVIERLKSVEQSVVESVFSQSTFGQSPGLVTADGIETLAGAGDTVTDVLSELERARYCGGAVNTNQYGPPGYLHVGIPVLNYLKRERLIEFDGTRWRTAMGTVVSAGCYVNQSPAAVVPADGTFWMYITGQTTVWRTSDEGIFVAPVEGSLNRATNQMLMIAERDYVVTYECGGFAKSVILWT